MKVFIFGSSGLVGHHCALAAHKRGFGVTAFYHSTPPQLPSGIRTLRLDLSNPEAAVRPLLDEFPDIVINAAALSSPGEVDAKPELAEKLNVQLPKRLAEVTHHTGGRIIHLSTDMVFDGTDGPYRSSDKPNPRTLYGQLKLLAEREVLKAASGGSVVLRLAIVTGNSPSGSRSLHEKLFATWASGKRPQLYTDEMRQPCSADNVADVLVELCERPNLSGIFHWAGPDRLSRYEMAVQILRRFGLPEDLVEPALGEGTGRPLDLTLELEPLLSKLRTKPAFYGWQLHDMVVPPLCQEWYAAMIGSQKTPAPLPRLIKGRDF